ncbi:MAG: hypothetical protein HUU22_02155 [Phycisphaerae bacterium]|nr:hypothetical protein [Phycisphaerae bacterium]
MQTIATRLKTTASFFDAPRAICCAVFATWSGFGAGMGCRLVMIMTGACSDSGV